MDLLNDDSVVYKLVGPVLVKQEADDAKLNVTNRLKFINGELYVAPRLFLFFLLLLLLLLPPPPPPPPLPPRPLLLFFPLTLGWVVVRE